MTEEWAEREVREHLFRPTDPGAPFRIGLEVEFLVMDQRRQRPIPPGQLGESFDHGSPTSIPILTELAARHGWRPLEAPGLPRFLLPHSTVLSFEPGGQIELATAPFRSLDALHHHLTTLLATISDGLARFGIALLARGLDPWTPAEEAELYLPLPRYQRMSEHYDRIGPAGRRMMRQSAGIHINLDLGPEPTDRWTRMNALVPLMMAMFANSPRREGEGRGWRSERAATWRHLDPSRCGVFDASEDSEGDYLAFARQALSFLFSDPGSPAPRWCDIEMERSREEWQQHLTTLFPEVRPRGYLEFRCVDALQPDLIVVAAAIAAGVAHHPISAAGLGLPAEPSGMLVAAGQQGVSDTELRARIVEREEVAEQGLTTLGEGVASASLIERVRAAFEELPRQRRDPGDRSGDWVEG